MKRNKKKGFIILLFIAGFFSLSMIGLTQGEKDSLNATPEDTIIIQVDEVVKQADEVAIKDMQEVKADKSNILDMGQKSGFDPINLLRGLMGMAV